MKENKEKVVVEELTNDLFETIMSDKTKLLVKLREFRDECIIRIDTLRAERTSLKKQKRELNRKLRVNWKALFSKRNEKRKLTREIKLQNSLIVELTDIYSDPIEKKIVITDFYPENPKTR